MSTTEIVPFASEHWTALRGRLHVDHLNRAQAVGPADKVLQHALNTSALVRTVKLDGQPEAIMGCGLLPGVGYPWLLKSPAAMARYWQVIRAAPAFVAECLTHRPVLRAEVPPDDLVVARWLRWLGFRSIGPGIEGHQRWEVTCGR